MIFKSEVKAKKSLPVKKGKKYGSLQIVHDFRFVALNVADDYSFLDNLSHEEKLEHIKKGLKSFLTMAMAELC